MTSSARAQLLLQTLVVAVVVATPPLVRHVDMKLDAIFIMPSPIRVEHANTVCSLLTAETSSSASFTATSARFAVVSYEFDTPKVALPFTGTPSAVCDYVRGVQKAPGTASTHNIHKERTKALNMLRVLRQVFTAQSTIQLTYRSEALVSRRYLVFTKALTPVRPAPGEEFSRDVLHRLYEPVRTPSTLDEVQRIQIEHAGMALHVTQLMLDHERRANPAAVARDEPSVMIDVTVLVPTENTAFVEVFGDPLLQAYTSNYRRFDAGVTLHNLDWNRMNHTLQALLLGQGYPFRVLDSTTVEDEQWLRHWPLEGADHDGRITLFEVHCGVGATTIAAAAECADDEQCVPHRGCVKNTKVADDDNDPIDERMALELGNPMAADNEFSNVTYRESVLDSPHTEDTGVDPEASVAADKVAYLRTIDNNSHDARYDDAYRLLAATQAVTPVPYPNKYPERGNDSWTPRHIVHGSVEVRHIMPDDYFLEDAIAGGRPVIFRGSVVTKWAVFTDAKRKWTWESLQQRMTSLTDVKVSNLSTFFTPCHKSALYKAGVIRQPVSYVVRNISSDAFFRQVQFDDGDDRELVYSFGRVPDLLAMDAEPIEPLFWHADDVERRNQYLWLSSAGVDLHTHFDFDHNMFVQVVGKKRFTLFPPNQIENLYPFPRVHPLWHKSQVHFDRPDLVRFPRYRHAAAYEAYLEPGDLLYIPPLWWHHVEALTPSVSLSTWSNGKAYGAVFAIYGIHLKVDRIEHPLGKFYACRVLIDILLRRAVGFRQVTSFLKEMMATRYIDLVDAFDDGHDIRRLCNNPRGIPSAKHVIQDTQFDVELLLEHFSKVERDMWYVLFTDFVEEVITSAIGVRKLLPFMRYCFLGQRLYNDPQLHYIWS